MNPKDIIDIVQKAASYLEGDFNITVNRVPRIIYKREQISASIVYCARSKNWKVFYPFPANAQKKVYFEKIEHVKDWLTR